MKLRSLSLVVVVLTACGGRPSVPTRPTLDTLRAEAQAAPNDPALQATLALAETFADGSDPQAAAPQVERALTLAPRRADLHLAAGLLHETSGHPGEAFDAYTRALQFSASERDPVSLRVTEVAVMGVVGLFDAFENYPARAQSVLQPMVDNGALLHPPARQAALSLLTTLAQRRGDLDAVRALAVSGGCVTRVRVAGPFGPRQLLGFDHDHTPDNDDVLAESYDLGPRRGTRSTRTINADGCALSLGGGPVADGGVTYVDATLIAPTTSAYVLRVTAPNSFVARIDGHPVLRADRRVEMLPGTLYEVVELSAGEHRLRVKVATRHPNPSLAVGLMPLHDHDRASFDGRAAIDPRDAFDDGFQTYLRATVAFQRDDVVGARTALRHIDGHHSEAPLLMMQAAHAWLRDPLTPSDVRSDRARMLLAASVARQPNLWSPTVHLARLEANNGRLHEAIAALRGARDRWPEIPGVTLTLIEMLGERGWFAEADRALVSLRTRFPHLCGGVDAAMDAARRKLRAREAATLAEDIMACNARSNARYATLLRQRKFPEAHAELQRLIALDDSAGPSFALRRSTVELALAQQDHAEADAELARLHADFPQASSIVLQQVDRTLARQGTAAALSVLDAALSRENAALAELRRVEGVLRTKHVMDAYRVDGLSAIAEFERSGHSYDGPQVLVWDYMVVRVFEDGSAIKLVHSIHRVQSDEAADDLGEVSTPDDARILTLRTVKADGRVLEPDAIGGKDTISLPNLAQGDYAETEYLIVDPPSSAFPQGYLGDRFFFTSFEVPFDTSHLLMVIPKNMRVTVDPRGPAPAMVESLDGELRVLSFKVTESRPLTREASSVAHREYVPSVRVIAQVPWSDLAASLRDALIDKLVVDPEIVSVVATIVGEAATDDHRLRAERLYAWVQANIEDDNQMFGQAAVMLRARAGNRVRVLHYLLRLAGVPAELALVRSKGSDATISEHADPETYGYLLLRVGNTNALWLSTVDRWAPFGHVPPALRGQDALMLTHDATIARVRESEPGEDQRTTVMNVRVASDGSAVFDVVEHFRGAEAASWRQALEGTPPAELKRRMEESYVAGLVPGARLQALEVQGRAADASSLVLRYSFEVSQLGRAVPQGWALPAIVPSRLAARYATVATRTTTELLTPPMDVDVTVHLHLPPQTRAPQVHADQTLNGPGGTMFSLRSTWQADVLTLQRRVRIPMTRVPVPAYPKLADLCRRVDAIESSEILVTLASGTSTQR